MESIITWQRHRGRLASKRETEKERKGRSKLALARAGLRVVGAEDQDLSDFGERAEHRFLVGTVVCVLAAFRWRGVCAPKNGGDSWPSVLPYGLKEERASNKKFSSQGGPGRKER